MVDVYRQRLASILGGLWIGPFRCLFYSWVGWCPGVIVGWVG